MVAIYCLFCGYENVNVKSDAAVLPPKRQFDTSAYDMPFASAVILQLYATRLRTNSRRENSLLTSENAFMCAKK